MSAAVIFLKAQFVLLKNVLLNFVFCTGVWCKKLEKRLFVHDSVGPNLPSTGRYQEGQRKNSKPDNFDRHEREAFRVIDTLLPENASLQYWPKIEYLAEQNLPDSIMIVNWLEKISYTLRYCNILLNSVHANTA